jgi:hypothetical protein
MAGDWDWHDHTTASTGGWYWSVTTKTVYQVPLVRRFPRPIRTWRSRAAWLLRDADRLLRSVFGA